MAIKGKIKRITLLRNLIAKGFFDEDGIRVEEQLAINELYELCEKRMTQDPVFLDKYGKWLITIHQFIKKHINGKKVYPIHFTEDISADKLKPFLPSRRAYLSFRKDPQMRNAITLKAGMSLEEVKKVSKKRDRYRDKGAARDLAIDGTPGWKEVAAAHLEDTGVGDLKSKVDDMKKQAAEVTTKKDWSELIRKEDTMEGVKKVFTDWIKSQETLKT